MKVFDSMHSVVSSVKNTILVLIKSDYDGNEPAAYTPYSQMADTREKTGA